jgi:hypothetical protein
VLDPLQYKGVPLEELRIDSVEWTPEREHHIRTRTERYGQNDKDIEPEWATEAALDPDRVLRVAGDEEATSSVKVVGYSRSAFGTGHLLKVWIWSDDPSSPVWSGGSATVANTSDTRRYEQ